MEDNMKNELSHLESKISIKMKGNSILIKAQPKVPNFYTNFNETLIFMRVFCIQYFDHFDAI